MGIDLNKALKMGAKFRAFSLVFLFSKAGI
jgi:isopentenyl diphosphate isomerase/L-lactate dehydrogenase-like FMN-dependent dehydrogenase